MLCYDIIVTVVLEILLACCRLLIVFKIDLLKHYFRNIIRVANSLDPDQARQDVGPILDPNCLQRLSTDDTSKGDKHSTLFSTIASTY